MNTIAQLARYGRLKRNKKIRVRALQCCPQKRGICTRVYVVNPKKPNSAKRCVARVRLFNRRSVVAYIPGGEHHLRQHGEVLIRGGRVKDLPGVRYKIIRGKKDCAPAYKRINKRSKYGLKILDVDEQWLDLIRSKYPKRFMSAP